MAAPLVAADELRASAPIGAWVAHPGGGDDGHDGNGGDDGCGDDGDGGTSFDVAHPGGCGDGGGDGGGVGWGDGGTGGPGGNPGGKHHCNPHFPSPENDTIVLGLLGGGAAFWPQLKAKIENFLK